MKAIVTGMVVTYPVGGVAWDYLQYALGLERLGIEVYYLEDTGWQTYDPIRQEYGEDCSYGVGFLQRTLADLSPTLSNRWHVRNMDGHSYGIDADEFARIVAGADLFLNVSGGTLLRDQYMRCPRKVLIESDPGWNHFVNFPKWDANPGWQGSHGWRAHDHFFTLAQRIGQPDCKLPTFGIDWHPTRPPVVMDQWRPQPPAQRWTTVMTWNNFGKPVEHNGVAYGTKEREFARVETLPSRVNAPLEIAAGGSPPTKHWRELGWSVVDSHTVSRTFDEYRDYIQRSRGEFSVAKNLYVATHSGWFSCRSVCYLAAGRPVVVQDTGFDGIIPTGAGLFAFKDIDEAAAAIEAVERNYEHHSTAAQKVAAEHFDSGVVLGDILQRVGLDAHA
jgi:hypothetical protein